MEDKADNRKPKAETDWGAILGADNAVMLVEGRRVVPDGVVDRLAACGKWLGTAFPHATFRTGNAAGSDTAFASGIACVAPARLQYVLTTPSMGRARRCPGGHSYALSELSQDELHRLCEISTAASPANRRLFEAACGRLDRRRLAGMGIYLLRDTLKVAGGAALGLAPATAGLFYIDPMDPMAGGTGHTIRVCRVLGVPVAFQEEFLAWPQK